IQGYQRSYLPPGLNPSSACPRRSLLCWKTNWIILFPATRAVIAAAPIPMYPIVPPCVLSHRIRRDLERPMCLTARNVLAFLSTNMMGLSVVLQVERSISCPDLLEAVSDLCLVH